MVKELPQRRAAVCPPGLLPIDGIQRLIDEQAQRTQDEGPCWSLERGRETEGGKEGEREGGGGREESEKGRERNLIKQGDGLTWFLFQLGQTFPPPSPVEEKGLGLCLLPVRRQTDLFT